MHDHKTGLFISDSTLLYFIEVLFEKQGLCFKRCPTCNGDVCQVSDDMALEGKDGWEKTDKTGPDPTKSDEENKLFKNHIQTGWHVTRYCPNCNHRGVILVPI
jgi:hypothetical protein